MRALRRSAIQRRWIHGDAEARDSHSKDMQHKRSVDAFYESQTYKIPEFKDFPVRPPPQNPKYMRNTVPGTEDHRSRVMRLYRHNMRNLMDSANLAKTPTWNTDQQLQAMQNLRCEIDEFNAESDKDLQKVEAKCIELEQLALNTGHVYPLARGYEYGAPWYERFSDDKIDDTYSEGSNTATNDLSWHMNTEMYGGASEYWDRLDEFETPSAFDQGVNAEKPKEAAYDPDQYVPGLDLHEDEEVNPPSHPSIGDHYWKWEKEELDESIQNMRTKPWNTK